jgi:hypothetical protein
MVYNENNLVGTRDLRALSSPPVSLNLVHVLVFSRNFFLFFIFMCFLFLLLFCIIKIKWWLGGWVRILGWVCKGFRFLEGSEASWSMVIVKLKSKVGGVLVLWGRILGVAPWSKYGDFWCSLACVSCSSFYGLSKVWKFYSDPPPALVSLINLRFLGLDYFSSLFLFSKLC